MKTGKRIGFAVVGLGHISQVAVLPAFRHSKKTKVVALVSGDEQKARRLAKKFGAPDYYNYDDYVLALNNPNVDAVFIATSNGTHAKYSIRAAQSGKHVLCEKPMATSLSECQQMIDTCRAHDVRLMIAYRKYFEPASVLLKTLVTRGKLGRLKVLHSGFTIHREPARSAWQLDRKEAGGGSLVDVGVYCVNTARWLVGRDPVEASGNAWTHNASLFREVDEHMAFQLKFPEGVLLQATSSFGAAQSSFLHVIGDKGWAALNPAYEFSKQLRLCGEIKGKWFEKKFKAVDEFALELDAFAEAIRRRRDPEPNGIEGLKDVAIMQAIYKSSNERRPMPINLY